MKIVDELKYTKNHEWLKVVGEEAYVGISDFAQSQLGDIVFVDVDTEGETIDKGGALGSIEAVKTVSDVFMPVKGEILEFNKKLEDAPELINKDPYGDGWIVKIKISDPQQINELLDSEAYKTICE